MPARPPRPLLSVIVPAHQAAPVIAECLRGLRDSDLPRDCWELIVVDDASTDDTELIAARYADTVVRLAGNPHGPAYARNRGAEASRGDVLVFVDADVVVHTDSLSRFARHFAAAPELSAVFGSYDVSPSVQDIVSQYRNLLHHYVHQRGAGPAETFWSGLGAIRADDFRQIGKFDEWHYARPQIEDIELGRRLRREGHSILLDPLIQGTHHKRWSLWSMLASDFRNRGVPWMWLLLREGPSAGRQKLNVQMSEKVCTALVAIGLLGLGSAVVWRRAWPLAVTGAAFLIVFLINLPLYRYLRRHRSLRFALGVMPLHLTYYISNVLAVGAGWLVHTLLGEPAPPVAAQALAQVGAEIWPPPISRPPRSVWAETGTSSPAPKEPPA